MKKSLSLVMFVLVLLSLSACGSHKNTVDEKTGSNNTNATSQSNDDSEDEPPFSLDAKPIDGKEYIGNGLTYVIYDDNSIEIVNYEGNQTEITIPSKINDYLVSRIATSAFEDCSSLEVVNIWADVIIVGESAFKGCTNLKEITIPHSVSEIFDSTFEGCSNLEEANIWGDVVRIGVNAFKNCISLKEITIPHSCLLVDKSAFEGCIAIEEVNLWGEGVIGEYAFKNCTSLKEITIPSEITEVKKSAFEGCTSLIEANAWGDNVIFGVNVFANCPKLEELPDGSYPDGVFNDNISNDEHRDVGEDNSSSTQTSTKICEECGKVATKETDLFGQTEYYCTAHYNEIMDIIDMMETDVGAGTASKHICEECNREGTHSIIGFSGATEYYCTAHYNELKELLEIFR